MMLDLCGGKWNCTLIAELVGDGRSDVIGWLLDRKMSELENLMPIELLAAMICCEGLVRTYENVVRWCIEEYPELDLDEFLPMAKTLGDRCPGVYTRAFGKFRGDRSI